MLKLSLALFLLATGLFTSLHGQGFPDLDKFNEGDWKIHWRATSVKPSTDGPYGGWTFNFGMGINNSDRWKARIRYENPTIGDFIFLLARMIRGGKTTTDSGLEHAFGGGFLGWFQYYNNVIATNRFIVSPGFTLSDYIFGFEGFDSTSSYGVRMYDPAGYHLAGGPAIMVSTAIGAGFWFDVYANYDMSFAKVKYNRANYNPIEGYPRPHWLSLGTDIHHNSGVYAGIRVNNVIDRGPNRISGYRMDVSVGYQFGR